MNHLSFVFVRLRLQSEVIVTLLVMAVVGPTATLFAQSSSHSDSTLRSRTITYHARDLVTLHAKIRYTTLIVLPDGDDVVEVACGDKDNWIVNVHASIVSVKPAKTGSATNLHVLTTSGQVYAFVLTEVSDRKGQDPDLTIYLESDSATDTLTGSTTPTGSKSAPRVQFVPAQQLEDFRLQAEVAREDARHTTEVAKAQLEEGLTTFKSTYPLTLRFPYRFKADVPPFLIDAMFHDDRMTYIRTHASELPSLYELKDGAPNLIDFEVHDGTYVVPKILDRGYLMVGKQRIDFRREPEYDRNKP